MQTPSLLKPINLRRSIAACLIGTFALRMAAGVMGSMLSLYFDHIDRTVEPLSFVARSLITAVFFLPELVGSPLFGAWSDKYGRKLFILLGPITGAIAVQITALTTLLPLLALTRFLEGLSTASAIPATLGYLSAATSDDESLRGKVVGLFELSTLGGTMGGILIGPLLFQRLENHAFTVNSVFYLVSLAIFFFGMQSARARTPTAKAARNWRTEFARTGDIFRAALKPIMAALTSSRILRFVPAWLAINMVLGVWLNGIVGQLVNSTRHFPGQLIFGMLRHSANRGDQIALGSAVMLGIFGLGVFLWSLVLGRFRRTSIMFAGTAGLFIVVITLFFINHARTLNDPMIPIYVLIAAIGLMVVSGFTPAALTYLADLTEDAPQDRGAIMGLYSVFFGLGQFIGQLLGGPFGDWQGFDGLLVLTAILGMIAVVTLLRLHTFERAQLMTAMSAAGD